MKYTTTVTIPIILFFFIPKLNQLLSSLSLIRSSKKHTNYLFFKCEKSVTTVKPILMGSLNLKLSKNLPNPDTLYSIYVLMYFEPW